MNYLVTGATGDLGRCIVRKLRYQKHWIGKQNTILATGQNADRLIELETLGAKTCSFTQLPEILKLHAPIDRAIHCIGSASFADDFAASVATNLESANTLISLMQRHGSAGASIVIVGSVAAGHACPGLRPYSAAKAGLRGLVRTAAAEMAPKRINLVEPGALLGRMHSDMTRYLSNEQLEAFRGRHLLGFASPGQISDAILAILEIEMMTGAVVPVDGGFSL